MKSTGAMGVSAKIILGLIVAIALGCKQSFAAPRLNFESSSYSEIQFTRCDNSTEPLGKIDISACKDQKEFCIFREGSFVTAEFDITPAQAHTTSDLGFDFNLSRVSVEICKYGGVKCPMEAGVKQHIKTKIPLIMDEQKGNKVKLFVTNNSSSSDPYWYCVEMPAKLIR